MNLQDKQELPFYIVCGFPSQSLPNEEIFDTAREYERVDGKQKIQFQIYFPCAFKLPRIIIQISAFNVGFLHFLIFLCHVI